MGYAKGFPRAVKGYSTQLIRVDFDFFVSGTPRDKNDVEVLSRLGIERVVTFRPPSTEKFRKEKQALEMHGIELVYLPPKRGKVSADLLNSLNTINRLLGGKRLLAHCVHGNYSHVLGMGYLCQNGWSPLMAKALINRIREKSFHQERLSLTPGEERYLKLAKTVSPITAPLRNRMRKTRASASARSFSRPKRDALVRKYKIRIRPK
ncbi:MAG: hypothetical protein J4215_01455 [Candidatus Diapherotrites archaeon]|uniref:Uncharacterized protein n=1 Tax=Candidatus Iainarchaeum sp. TaxID=3101447 RepID=A0A8T4L375_9ARCH|nr:hypothetical protein [Candidatus Diapherotrites archaeon]